MDLLWGQYDRAWPSLEEKGKNDLEGRRAVIRPNPTLAIPFALMIAAIACSESASPVESGAGYSSASPADIGTPLTVEFEDLFGTATFEARIALVDIVRGGRAEALVDIPSFLAMGGPGPGDEWLLAKVRFELLEASNGSTGYDLTRSAFAAVSADDRTYRSVNPMIHIEEPSREIAATLYSNTSQEGWIPFQVAVSDPIPLLAFVNHAGGAGLLCWELSIDN